jgi:hypothetical protein
MQYKVYHRKRKLWFILTGLAGLVILLWIWFFVSIHVSPPVISDRSADTLHVSVLSPYYSRCGPSWLRENYPGFWTMYLKGKAYERGVMNGKLSKTLICKQEKAFVKQIRMMIPSDFYLHFLKYFIYWFNRDLDKNISEEYKQEIYGISQSASEEFGFIGNNYQRMLNYHSAHDIGHALQEMNLVGCTSFGVWGDLSADSSLIVGRNFDFYMGDEFAENKIICFEQPDSGYAFMMVTWGSMIGAVSGMNEKGLTVTINAARSDIPYSARTPISLLAREILQYASDIAGAYAIAGKRRTFVSESLLIGSAKDGKAAIIEKSPHKLALVEPQSNCILCANHFQSPEFAEDPLNKANIKENASLYRYHRLQQDISQQSPVSIPKAALILRDRAGLNGKNIGLGNEKAMNQLIAHHSVIFKPSQLLVWISTNPWQLGSYKCFDLKKIFHNFAQSNQGVEIEDTAKEVPPDTFLKSPDYLAFLEFKAMKRILQECIKNNRLLDRERSFIAAFIHANPEFYESYFLVGEYFLKMKNTAAAHTYFYRALRCEVPRWQEKQKIIRRIAECNMELKRF